MEDKRMNEIEEIEATEVDETQDSSNAGALLAGVIGGFIAYAVIGGAKKLRDDHRREGRCKEAGGSR